MNLMGAGFNCLSVDLAFVSLSFCWYFLKTLQCNIFLIKRTRNVWYEYYIVLEILAKDVVSQRSCCRKKFFLLSPYLLQQGKNVPPLEETLAVLTLQTHVGRRNSKKLNCSLVYSSR